MNSRFVEEALDDRNPIEPSHYTEMPMSPLEYITINEGEFTWCIANVIKYASRYKRKNGLEDLKKARWYLEFQIKLEEMKYAKEIQPQR
jgi:hypothetical protein